MTKTVLILGANGRIGRHATQAFAAAGWQVKRFNRSRGNMTEAARGCDVIVNGLNPPNYHDWDNIIPAITKEVIYAARHSGATVILPGNVYHFGDTPGVWSEKTAPSPVSRKGKIRLDMEKSYAKSGIQTIVLRAGNFIDPDLNGCVMAELYMRSFKAGKVMLPGPADTRQAMCYLPDWGGAAVQLAEMRGRLSQFEDVPFPGHTVTADGIKEGLERITGRKLRFARFPWWLFSLTAPVWELAREMREMRYLWTTDHALSAERFDALLPEFRTTPFDEVLRTVAATALGQDQVLTPMTA